MQMDESVVEHLRLLLRVLTGVDWKIILSIGGTMFRGLRLGRVDIARKNDIPFPRDEDEEADGILFCNLVPEYRRRTL